MFAYTSFCIVLIQVRVYTVEKQQKQLWRGPIALLYTHVTYKFIHTLLYVVFNNALTINIHISKYLYKVSW
jgi:ABC-type transporter lipoprotein component MlaA